MMITRESDYAIRIIRALKDGELLPLEQICQRELVPKQFAYKILKKLERSGLVSIRRGAGGGCILNRSLADLTLLDIIKAADEEFFLNPAWTVNTSAAMPPVLTAAKFTVNWQESSVCWKRN